MLLFELVEFTGTSRESSFRTLAAKMGFGVVKFLAAFIATSFSIDYDAHQSFSFSYRSLSINFQSESTFASTAANLCSTLKRLDGEGLKVKVDAPRVSFKRCWPVLLNE